MKRYLVNLTFDLEEFDIPEEYGEKVSHQDQMEITSSGTLRLLRLLDKHEVRATFFTTGNYARQNPELVRLVASKHEIASHALYHDPFYVFQDSDMGESKRILEEVSGQKITGFRMPRLKPFSMDKLRLAGYEYDSSLNPTFLPGRYNLLHENPLPNKRNGLIELPCSCTPIIRFPLFWLAFKNLPITLYAWLCGWTLREQHNLMLYFHPWEFADIQRFKLPGYVKKPDGEKLVGKLETLIVSLKKNGGEFVTCQALCEELKF
jgi:hypothetical protein